MAREALAAIGDPLRRVHGFRVARSSEQARAIVSDLVREIFALEGRQCETMAAVDIDDSQVGAGYGQPTAAMTEAVELVVRTEGIPLDPVYTGRTMASLLSSVRNDAIAPGETVVFWQPGGARSLRVSRGVSSINSKRLLVRSTPRARPNMRFGWTAQPLGNEDHERARSITARAHVGRMPGASPL